MLALPVAQGRVGVLLGVLGVEAGDAGLAVGLLAVRR